jgi:predicted N-acyltransferase
VADALIRGALEQARPLGLSSLHWLFTTDEDTRRLESHGLMRRTGQQFHWENSGYRDFADFLDRFSADKSCAGQARLRQSAKQASTPDAKAKRGKPRTREEEGGRSWKP